MDSHITPSYQKSFGDYWVLWFKSSNSYSVIDVQFKRILDTYLDKHSRIVLKPSESQIIIDYLSACIHENPKRELKPSIKLNSDRRVIFKRYHLNGNTIGAYFDSELVLKTIHPQIAHLERTGSSEVDILFEFFVDDQKFVMLRDSCTLLAVPRQDYHKIQGKFNSELLNIVHNKAEKDWIGTFHGSTIADGQNSILFIGTSGSGKSTLSALLMHAGFELIADDVSPLSADQCHIYTNPFALSIKKGAFAILSSKFSEFENLAVTRFNPKKGELKYLAPVQARHPHYPCKAIILINYKPNSNTVLEQVSVKSILETMIPDSWLSDETAHAEQFLTWLGQQQFFQLIYSDSQEVITCISNLFKTFN